MNAIRALIDALLLLGGLGFVVRGIWMWSTPAGFIALGLAMLLTFAAQQTPKRK